MRRFLTSGDSYDYITADDLPGMSGMPGQLNATTQIAPDGVTWQTIIDIGQNQLRWHYIEPSIISHPYKSGTGTQFIVGSISSPSANQVLMWNGTNWVNSAVPDLSATYVTLSTTQTISGAKTFTAATNITLDGIHNTNTTGLSLSNTTASTALQTIERSPDLVMNWHVWETGTPADQTGAFRITAVPTSGATPSVTMRFQTNLNGAGYTNQLSFTSAGAVTAAGSLTATTSITAGSTNVINWSSRGGARAIADGQFKVNNESNNAIGSWAQGNFLEARTTNKTLTFVDSNTLFTNTGATGTVTLTLPSATLGTGNASMVFHGYIDAAQSLTFDAAGTDTIQNVGTTSSAGGTITANTVGNAITLRCVASGKWAVTGYTGTWTTT